MRFSLLIALLATTGTSGFGSAADLAVQPAVNEVTGNPIDLGRTEETPARLNGSREEQLAQVLAAIVPLSASRDWAAAQAAFPGARWEVRTSDTTPTRVEGGITYPGTLEDRGYTDLLDGSIDLNGDRFRIEITGTPEQVNGIRLNAPEGLTVNRAALRRALAARGAEWRPVRCNPIGDANVPIIVELIAGGGSTTMEDTFSGFDEYAASSYSFFFEAPMFDPEDPPGDCTGAGLMDPL